MSQVECTVLGGFPVIVEFSYQKAEPDVGIMRDYCEIEQVLTTKGKPADFITRKMTDADWDDLNEQVNSQGFDHDDYDEDYARERYDY